MSAKSCGNCGTAKPQPDFDTPYTFCPLKSNWVLKAASCAYHNPLIPAGAQSFVICNGKVRVWCVLEDVQSCSNCDFKAICNAIPTAILGCNNKHYRIVAVEMVEGE